MRADERGFTLLELLVALAIAALILLGVYRVVDGTASRQRSLETRQERLQLWFYLRRLLRRDVEALSGNGAEEIALDGDGGVTLRVSGRVLPDWRLGPQVAVRYRWSEDPDTGGVAWSRTVTALEGGDGEKGLELAVTEGLREVTFEVLDKNGWAALGEGAEPPFLAVRWQFRWEDIGDWASVRATPR